MTDKVTVHEKQKLVMCIRYCEQQFAGAVKPWLSRDTKITEDVSAQMKTTVEMIQSLSACKNLLSICARCVAEAQHYIFFLLRRRLVKLTTGLIVLSFFTLLSGILVARFKASRDYLFQDMAFFVRAAIKVFSNQSKHSRACAMVCTQIHGWNAVYGEDYSSLRLATRYATMRLGIPQRLPQVEESPSGHQVSVAAPLAAVRRFIHEFRSFLKGALEDAISDIEMILSEEQIPPAEDEDSDDSDVVWDSETGATDMDPSASIVKPNTLGHLRYDYQLAVSFDPTPTSNATTQSATLFQSALEGTEHSNGVSVEEETKEVVKVLADSYQRLRLEYLPRIETFLSNCQLVLTSHTKTFDSHSIQFINKEAYSYQQRIQALSVTFSAPLTSNQASSSLQQSHSPLQQHSPSFNLASKRQMSKSSKTRSKSLKKRLKLK